MSGAELHRLITVLSLIDSHVRYEAYFDVVQRHMPLVSRQIFFQKLSHSKDHQALALKYAICMAGAYFDSSLAEQCYMTTRYHLEHAELETDGSSIWTIEAAQTLILMARFELTHLNSPRVLITMSRLRALQSNLRDLTWPVSTEQETSDQKQSAQHEMALLIGLSLSLQDMSYWEYRVTGNKPHVGFCSKLPNLISHKNLPPKQISLVYGL